jgi:hypothetical protein
VKPESYPKWETVWRVPAVMERPSYTISRRTLCFHEAGHAVAMRYYNICPREALVRDDLTGHVRPPEHNAPAPNLTPFLEQWVATEAATVYCAGLQAELLLQGLPLSGVLLVESSDATKARSILFEAFGHGLGPVYYAQRLARAILKERWALVGRVAQALDRHNTLSAQNLEHLFFDSEQQEPVRQIDPAEAA